MTDFITFCKKLSTACTIIGVGANLLGGAADKKIMMHDMNTVMDKKIEEKLAKALAERSKHRH